MNKDYYKILGVDKNASPEELKKAYRKLSMQLHPDRQNGKSEKEKKEAEERFKDVNEAYSVLSDKDKRANYDRFGTADVNQGFGGNGFDPFEFFRHMHSGFGDFGDFGFNMGGFNTNSNRDPNAPEDGKDIRVRIQVSFEEAVYGSVKEFSINVDDHCDHCHGTGSEDGNVSTCPTCGGTGMVEQRRGPMIMSSTCPTCMGTGGTISNPCHHCHGSGYTKSKRDIKIKIPQGVETGNNLRVSGKGMSGLRGGRDGDLLVNIVVNDNDLFKINGLNLITETYISPVTAILGGNIDVQSPWGVVKMKVPAGTQNGKTFRVSGKGMKTNRGIGDLYVKVNIESLVNISSSQKKILEELNNTINDSNIPESVRYRRQSKDFEDRTKGIRK